VWGFAADARVRSNRPEVIVKYGRVLFEATLAACVGAVVLGSTLAFSAARFGGPENEYKFIDPVLDVKSLISERYVEAPDEKALRDGAIKGMVEALNDPYTIYVPASERTEFTKELTGEYVGIGAQVQIVDQWLTIVSPLEDSPAFKAGILPGDRVSVEVSAYDPSRGRVTFRHK